MADDRRPLISLLAARETSPSVLFGLYDVLVSAGVIFPELTTGKPGEQVLDVKIVAATSTPFHCYGDIMVEPHAGIDDLRQTDVVIVCDMYLPIDAKPRERYPREVEWIRQMHQKGAILASVCSGSLVLAETGLLNGLEATGHWAYRHVFREYYPEVKWREEAILCFAGERNQIVTAGSVTAWHELALHLIARLSGPEHAINIAKVFLLGDHEDGQLPYAAMTRYTQHADAVIGDCQKWISENYACSNPVARMAAFSGLKPRTFARRFQTATGYRPIEYVHGLRIEEAKRMLGTDNSGIDEIAGRVGYEDPTSFRRLFKRKAGLTPAAFRRKFAGLAGTKEALCRAGDRPTKSRVAADRAAATRSLSRLT